MLDLSDPRTPTWPELELGGHIRRVQASLVVYFAFLTLFWAYVAGKVAMPEVLFGPLACLAGLNYLFLIWGTYKIQSALNESRLHKHAGWQILVGAVILNPCALGWWMPVSVLVAAGGVRHRLEARWPRGRE